MGGALNCELQISTVDDFEMEHTVSKKYTVASSLVRSMLREYAADGWNWSEMSVLRAVTPVSERSRLVAGAGGGVNGELGRCFLAEDEVEGLSCCILGFRGVSKTIRVFKRLQKGSISRRALLSFWPGG